MTFGFFLLTAGFLLLDSGWKGTTPIQVLRGLSAGPGPRGPITQTGKGLASAVTGSAPPGVMGPIGTGQGEAVIKKGGQKKAEQSLKKSHPELKPGIRTVAAVVLSVWPGLSITSTTGGTHADGSYHYKGRAVDIGGDAQEMNKAAQWIGTYLTKTLSEGIHNPNLSVDGKKKVDPSFWGSETWSAHLDHIHLAV